MSAYHDYRYRFPVGGLARATEAFAALRAAGLLPAEGLPENMLGDPLLLDGAEVARGRSGRAAWSYADPVSGAPVAVPACGDPGSVYVHIRSDVAPSQLPPGFDPAAYGLTATTVEESAAVLGVWA
jgi:hypothetical protein